VSGQAHAAAEHEHRHENRHEHRVVLASAGTGKTFALTNRLIALLADGAPPERILAATFTRAAAAEITDRVLQRLAQASTDPDAAAELARHTARDLAPPGWAAVLAGVGRRAHRLRIGTLDKVAVQLARSLGPRLGLARSWRHADDADAARLRTLAIEAALRDAGEHFAGTVQAAGGAEAGATPAEALARLLDAADADVLDASPQAWDCLGPELPRLPDPADTDDALARLAEAPLPATKAGAPNRNWAKAVDAVREKVAGDNWQGLLESGLIAKVHNGEQTYYSKPIEPAMADPLGTLGEIAAARVLHALHERNRAVGQALAAVRDALRDQHHEAGLYTLGDLWHALGRADLDAQEVAYRLDAGIDHVLLDEFQDTSADQWRVLEPLVDEALAGGERSRSVFIVGDVKQSLYGWRNAAPELLAGLPARWPQVQQATLSTTRRCAPAIVRAVNTLFASIDANPALAGQPGAQDFARVFEPHSASRTSPALVRLRDAGNPHDNQNDNQDDDQDNNPDNNQDDNQDDTRQGALIHAVARAVLDIHSRRPSAGVAVLVRRNRLIGPIVAELGRLGVAASANARAALADHPAPEAVLCALHLAAHPGDSAARYAVRGGPLAENAGLTGHDDAAAAERFAARIRAAIFERGAAAVVADLCHNAERATNPRGRDRLRALLALAEQWERDTPPADAAAEGIDGLVRRARAARAPASDAAAGVRVLTLHAAKGLEFEAVVLADLDRSLPGRPPILLADQPAAAHHPQSENIRATLAPPRHVARLTDLTRTLDDQHRRRAIFEELCLLYVGMTRARDHLELVANPAAKSATPTLARAAWAGLAGSNAGGDHQFGDESWLHGREAKAAQPVAPRHAPPPPWASPARHSPPAAAESWRVPLATPSHAAAPTVARLLGTSGRDRSAADLGLHLHAILEQVAWLEDAPADPAQWAEQAGLPAEGPAVERLRAALRDGGLRDALSRRALAERLGEDLQLRVHRELPIAALVERDGGRVLVRGRIDRLVVGTHAGRAVRAVVMDYKTGLHEGDDAATDRSEYEQLELYRLAVAARESIDAAAVAREVVRI